MVHYKSCTTDGELHQILDLQKRNHPDLLTDEERQSQGFVTVKHDFETLEAMNTPFAHSLAISDDRVVGYALTMERSMKARIPILQPMFATLDTIYIQNRKMSDEGYIVMGQICVEKIFRGKGVFRGLYSHMRSRLRPHFRYLITEISERNTRSLNAHSAVGFQKLITYDAPDGERWVIVGWNWNQSNTK